MGEPEREAVMCISLGAIAEVLIWVVVICALIKILSLLVSFIAAKVGAPFAEFAGILIQILTIIFWAALCVGLILLVFNLLACLLSGGLHLPNLIR